MAEARKAIRGRVIRQKAMQSRTLFDLESKRGPQSRVLFYHLILLADDDGRFLAEAPIVASRAFPWGQRSAKQVEADLEAMAELGLIRLYGGNGTRYGHFPTWFDHQTKPDPRRYFPSEFPEPPEFTRRWHTTDGQSAGQNAVQDAVQSTVQNTRQDSDSDSDSDSDLKPRTLRKEKASTSSAVVERKKTAPTTGQPVVVHHVHDTLKAKLEADPKLNYPAMGKWLRDILKTRTPEHVNEVWDHWLTSEDGWAKQHAWSWNQFMVNFNAVEFALKEGKPYGQRANRGGSKRMEAAGEGDFGPGGEVDWDTALGATLPGV